jgi:transposase-like protein
MSPSARGSSSKYLPACPSCHSKKTIRTHEQLGEQLFFCADCEHTWSIRAGKTPAKNRR